MTLPATRRLQHPTYRSAADEGLHEPPPEAADRLFGDTVWLSLIDPEAGVWGAIHQHICPNRGYGRFGAYLEIDGVEQVYLGKAVGGLAYGDTHWSDGRMTYDVLVPFEQVRVTLDGPRFSFDLVYSARHVTFDYDDCVGGSLLEGLKPAAGIHGGHYEQAMQVRGTFETHAGPRAGETRAIHATAHRDHTWSDRFAGTGPWAYPEGVEASLHFWLVLQFPERGMNATGFFDLSPLGISRPIDRSGGFESTDQGARPIVSCRPVGDLVEPRGRTTPNRWRIAFADGDVIHVSMPEPKWIAKLRMQGEDDAESRLNDFETFGEILIEETGERGVGVFEHSTLPPSPRWLA
jgi:hypothetical protein